MKRFRDLVAACLSQVQELFPWDLKQRLDLGHELLLLDVREPYEFAALHLAGSINVPRGILECACEYGYEETHPGLAGAREREIVVVCRSGQRSVLAAHTLAQLGYGRVWSLRTGLRGWNDYAQPLVDGHGRPVPEETADAYFTPRLRPEQLPAARTAP